ncbi:MAG: polynucleotide adenylyltransferase PcnB [Myxococcota bacterium]
MDPATPEREDPIEAELDDVEGLTGAPRPAIYPNQFPSEHMDPDAVKVIRRLRRYGHTAYLVGGGVRDLLLGRRPKDFDVATSAQPHEVRRLFRNCRVIGRRFRLAHILFAGGKIIEVATFRRDPMQAFDVVEGEFAEEMEAAGEARANRLVPRRKEADDDVDLLIRHDNVFGEPHEDAIRRDFTINGLFYDIERGEVIDYVGGVPDLERRVVRTIGDPDVRFREDPVRILRAIKFSARLDMGIAPDVYDAMVDHRSELERAARPRLLEEILRLLRGGAAHRSIYLMWDLGVLAELLPEVASYLDDDGPEAELTWGRLDAVDRRQREGYLPTDPVLLAALLLGPIEEAIEDVRDPSAAFADFVEGVAERLVLPRRIKDRLRTVVTSQRRLRSGRLGALPRREYFADAATLFAVDREARGEEIPAWAEAPERADDGSPSSRGRRRRRRRRRRS